MPSLPCPADGVGHCCTQSQMIVKPWWKFASLCGMRRLGSLLQKANPKAYGDTLTHFPTTQPFIALTIDDGLVRGHSDCSMVQDVLAVLAKYHARATFFVCTDYVQDQDHAVRLLLELQADKLWYYPKLEAAEFQAELQSANAILEDLEHRCGGYGNPGVGVSAGFELPKES